MQSIWKCSSSGRLLPRCFVKAELKARILSIVGGVQERLFSVKEEFLFGGLLGKSYLKGCINCTLPRLPFLLYVCDEKRFHSKCMHSTGNFTPIIRGSFVCVVTVIISGIILLCEARRVSCFLAVLPRDSWCINLLYCLLAVPRLFFLFIMEFLMALLPLGRHARKRTSGISSFFHLPIITLL